MTRLRSLLVGSLVILAALAVGAIIRMDRESRILCADADPARAEASKSACTLLIDWGFWLDDAELAVVYANRGYAFDDMGDYVSAIADYDVSLMLNPNNPIALNNRGLSYNKVGDFARAIEDYDRALLLDPHDPTAYSNRALAHALSGKVVQAMDDYGEALRLDPGNVSANGNRGIIHFFQGNWKQASADLDWALVMGGSAPYRSLWRALALARDGQVWREALAADAAGLDLREWPGPIMRLLLGEIPEAQILSEAWDVDPVRAKQRQCEAHFYLGQRALIEGESAKARSHFEEALRSDVPGHLEYQGARVELLRM